MLWLYCYRMTLSYFEISVITLNVFPWPGWSVSFRRIISDRFPAKCGGIVGWIDSDFWPMFSTIRPTDVTYSYAHYAVGLCLLYSVVTVNMIAVQGPTRLMKCSTLQLSEISKSYWSRCCCQNMQFPDLWYQFLKNWVEKRRLHRCHDLARCSVVPFPVIRKWAIFENWPTSGCYVLQCFSQHRETRVKVYIDK